MSVTCIQEERVLFFLHNASSKLCIFKVPAEVCKYLETLSRVVWNSDDLSQGEPDLVADQVVVEVLRPQLNPHEVLLDPLGQVLALAVRVETLQQFSRVSPHTVYRYKFNRQFFVASSFRSNFYVFNCI